MANLILYERRGVFVDQAGPSGPGPSLLWARIEPSFRSWAGIGPKIWVHLTNGPCLNSVVECLKAGPCLFGKNGTWTLGFLYMYAHPSYSRSSDFPQDPTLHMAIISCTDEYWISYRDWQVSCAAHLGININEGKKVMVLWFESNDMHDLWLLIPYPPYIYRVGVNNNTLHLPIKRFPVARYKIAEEKDPMEVIYIYI